jgi:two-component system, sensor histidine kinase and response regulator
MSVTSPLPRIKVLLVDDLAENLLALRSLLRRDDLELLQAKSGREALELLLDHEVAVALIDVQMPEMDGFELAELMRGSERTRHVPIILVTAGSREEQRVFRGYDAGATDFLFKPLEPYAVQSKVDTFVQLHRQRQLLDEQILDMQRARAEHERLLQELRETLQLNETLVAVLAHDLRNPLNVISVTAALLARHEEPAVKKSAERLRTAGGRMARLVSDLLDFARAKSGGGIPIAPRPTSLDELSAPLIEEHRLVNRERRIDFEHDGDMRGTWDEDRLAQVVGNLVGNAVQHGQKDEIILLKLDGSRPGEVLLSVENGGEIPSSVAPRLFEPFASGARPHDGGRGLGLGLFIVRQIARAHGGDVTARSSGGHTTISVRLPRGGSA